MWGAPRPTCGLTAVVLAAALLALIAQPAAADTKATLAEISLRADNITAWSRKADTVSYFSLFGNLTNFQGRLVADFMASRRRDIAGLSDGCTAFSPTRQVLEPWVAVLERGQCKFIDKVVNARGAGAIAVIIVNMFQSSEPPFMGGDVGDTGADKIPSISVTLDYGVQLLEYINQNKTPYIRVQVGSSSRVSDDESVTSTWVFGHVVIFAGTTVLVSLVVMVAYYCRGRRQRAQQQEVQHRTRRILTRIPTRLFTSSAQIAVPEEEMPACAVCLEDFKEGDELRVLPCKHELHRSCVDPWLEAHHTCPLCKANVLGEDDHEEAEAEAEARRRRQIAAQLQDGEQMELQTVREHVARSSSPTSSVIVEDVTDDIEHNANFDGSQHQGSLPSGSQDREDRDSRQPRPSIEYLGVSANSSAIRVLPVPTSES